MGTDLGPSTCVFGLVVTTCSQMGYHCADLTLAHCHATSDGPELEYLLVRLPCVLLNALWKRRVYSGLNVSLSHIEMVEHLGTGAWWKEVRSLKGCL